jgi:hypothetical protein
MTTTYRTNADGSVVCKHRDLSVCPACLAADPNLVDVLGAVFVMTPAERAARTDTAWDRDEADSCEAGTPGCSVRHTRPEQECATW